MPDELTCKSLVAEHCRRVNAGDLDGLLALYAPTVRFEDPVGNGEQVGIPALRAHAGAAIQSRAYEDFGTPVAGQDGASAAIPVVTTMDYLPWGPNLVRLGLIPAPPPGFDPGRRRIRFNYVMTIAVGADGLIRDMRGYWGVSDAGYVDADAGEVGR